MNQNQNLTEEELADLETHRAVGDVVQLKSGGPLMTVISRMEHEVKCMWFGNENTTRTLTVPEECLYPMDDSADETGEDEAEDEHNECDGCTFEKEQDSCAVCVDERRFCPSCLARQLAKKEAFSNHTFPFCASCAQKLEKHKASGTCEDCVEEQKYCEDCLDKAQKG